MSINPRWLACMALSLALAGGLLAGGTARAEAADYSLTTPFDAPPADGQARSSGRITFINAKRFRVSGTINDICREGDGDGYGAYLRATVFHPDGTRNGVQIATDTRGCNRGARAFDTTVAFDGPPGLPNKRVGRVQLSLIECDADTLQCSNDFDESRVFNNPFV